MSLTTSWQIDPNRAWKAAVSAARLAKQRLDVTVEYNDGSDQPGRKMKLWYDPQTDTEGWKYLDN